MATTKKTRDGSFESAVVLDRQRMSEFVSEFVGKDLGAFITGGEGRRPRAIQITGTHSLEDLGLSDGADPEQA